MLRSKSKNVVERNNQLPDVTMEFCRQNTGCFPCKLMDRDGLDDVSFEQGAVE